MQTLRKKTSPLKYKNETSRFLGEGVSFKAKLIGILEVSEARGDRMCQDALSDLKMAIRAAGEHKQRIIINIAIDGLRLRDEKTGDSLYHHPVHKISFIAQDMTDSRAFGYIFGSPDTGHRFFGIKTDKAASQVVIAMRDLFQVVFALKKKEIEVAKQNLDKSRFSSSPLFSETLTISKVQSEQDSAKVHSGSKTDANNTDKSGGGAVADLVDLELELNNLQQGLTQMERITPSDPFGSKEDPFGDSFISYPQKPILPPPPSSRDRSSRTSDASSAGNQTKTALRAGSIADDMSFFKKKTGSNTFDFSHDFSTSGESASSNSWFMPLPSAEGQKTAAQTAAEQHEAIKQEILSQFDVFTELDPLDLKNPPKKVLNDLVPQPQPPQETPPKFAANFDPHPPKPENLFTSDPFAEDPFKDDPFADFAKQDPFETEKTPGRSFFFEKRHENVSLDMSSESECAPEPPPRPGNTLTQIPPPLPPKKQAGDLLVKPPPRPPYSDEAQYEHVDNHCDNALSPPLPVPSRRPKTDRNKQKALSSDEGYLTPISAPPPNLPADGLDTLNITLSQLTLTGLNDLASKLGIPPQQLSNMTLVQLTNYLTTFIRNSSKASEAPTFTANFNSFNSTTSEFYDRYAAFRELLKEEVRENKSEESIKSENSIEASEKTDKYAALREIVDLDIKTQQTNDVDEENTEVILENEANILKVEEKDIVIKDALIKYTEVSKQDNLTLKSPENKTPTPLRSPVTEVIQKTVHLTSGSLSDAVSGSSPEIDNTASAEIKKSPDVAAESWAIFDQPNLSNDENKPKQSVQSEEALSPWSSDSKEFGNGSPVEGRQRMDSSSGGDQWVKIRGKREQDGWWDASAEPEFHHYPANRRSTDSYEDECYDYYDRPRRRRQANWSGAEMSCGHSSSSRDVSPWEEEPRRRDVRAVRDQEHREMKPNYPVYPRHSAERYRERKHADSWDEEDDYEYEEEHSSRFHWPERHMKRDVGRDRHGTSSREHIRDRWLDTWEGDRKYRRRREMDRERWCCPDWDHEFQNKHPGRCPPGWFPGSDTPPSKWHENKHEDHHYGRAPQESPWDDDYSNDPEESNLSSCAAPGKRNWKRPSSASEMERKVGEMKSRHGGYLGTGGSDGERERRHKVNRRSKSRDSQFPESGYNRHKIEADLTARRSKQHSYAKPQLDSNEFSATLPSKKSESYKSESANKKLTFSARKKPKESPSEEITAKMSHAQFENDFTPPEMEATTGNFGFASDFKPTARSRLDQKPKPHIPAGSVGLKQKSLFEDDFSPTERSPHFHEDGKIPSIEEELSSGGVTQQPKPEKTVSSRKRILNRNRLSSSLKSDNGNLKKSESVNIFARESDPFDDAFFTEETTQDLALARGSDLKWSDQFQDFDMAEEN